MMSFNELQKIERMSDEYTKLIGGVLKKKNTTVRTITSDKISPDEAFDRYNITLQKYEEMLNNTADLNIDIAPEIEKERSNYRFAILHEIKNPPQEFNVVKMTHRIEKIVTYFVDYLQGPRIYSAVVGGVSYQYLQEAPEKKLKERLRTVQQKDKSDLYKYVYTFEEKRGRERKRIQRLYGKSPTKVFAEGGEYISVPDVVGRLTYSLMEFIQPKLQIIDWEKEEREKMRKDINYELKKIAEDLKKYRSGKFLIVEHPEVIEEITNEIRERGVQDLISGHPLGLKLRNIIEEDKTLNSYFTWSTELRMRKYAARRFCSQAVTYDNFLHSIYGYHQLRIINIYFKKWGLPEIATENSGLKYGIV